MGSTNLCETLLALSKEVQDTPLKKTLSDIQVSLAEEKITLRDVIHKLAEYIIDIDTAKLFKKYLSNILLALVSARIPLKKVLSDLDFCNETEKISHLEFSTVLGVLCDHPDVLQYALKYFEINSVPPFEVFINHEDTYNVAAKKRRLSNTRYKVTDHQIVTCCYNLFCKLPNELSSKWDWTKFVEHFSNHENIEIRCMVKDCMVMLTNMTELQSKTLSINMSITGNNALKLKFDEDLAIKPIDGIIKDENLSANVVNIDGIMLPIYNRENIQNGRLVPVVSTVNNLRSLALAVASGKAVSLLGPVGSGKTCLVEHLAAVTGRKTIAFKKVQLGDQTDSRMLLGSHQCTDVPGEFIWRPGVLTEAVQNGHWLLLEDIDCAALDVASTLSSLLERNSLCVPGYRDALPVTPGFQLFVTQRSLITNYGFQKKMSSSSALLQKHLTQINVEPLSRSELGEIIQKLYPSLTSISSRMIEVFMMFSVGSHDTSLQSTEIVDKDMKDSVKVIRGSRLISTRDLMKWCSRSVQGFAVASPESALKVLQDALDIFTSSVPSPDDRLELAKKVGTCLGIVDTKTEFYCKQYKPNVSLTAKTFDVGRAKVLKVEKTLENINFITQNVVFSFTKQSACLLEKIACCVTSNEPVLLVGETGTGKTSSVQYIARQTGHKLVVINMNQQSDSADLLGGYKPVDMKYVVRPIKLEFEELFRSFYNVEKNVKFLGHIETCYESENWLALLALMKQSNKAAINRITKEKKAEILKLWLAFGYKLNKLELQVKAGSRLTFAFIEGSLVKAMQEGHWVLLDEINLASAEILECLAGLLEDKTESIDLIEKGDKAPIRRHPDFTLFACMNPATDVGKKDLPVGLRNRFTEFFIDELTERNDLVLLIGDYLCHMNLGGPTLESIYNFYSHIRKEAKLSLIDGAGNAPHYSLRTLCRALTAAAKARCGTVARSLYEAFCLSFLTQLDSASHPKVEEMISKAVLGKKTVKSILNQLIPEPQIAGQNYLLFEGHWIPQGKLEIAIPEGYILTPTVRKNLRDIARIISIGRLPVLLQGDTSVGKTSLITYIAKASGNYCVRINNHEHTDLQEYIGSYASDTDGKLVFKEGVLVEAMKKGYWIILDELNLAPSDVLEALNRVLDDNRELFIPETQQVIKADPNFMLFATQNPPGMYGGRKMLSRAFRNRFVELHFDEIPKKELETILNQRCHVPPTYCKKMISVMSELQIRRRGSAAVQGKDGFITLRDLFRWGNRYKYATKEKLTEEKFYDWDQHIADEGYLILAGKVRQPEERNIILDVIEKQIKRKINPDNLFTLNQTTSPVSVSLLETILNNQLNEFGHVVWTYNMRRLAVLIAKAFTFDEPVLLVGETGCGKTTICQVLAALSGRQLLSVNCHMHTESSDFLGSLRPVRQYKNDGRLFEWVDGPLVKAMKNGDIFLADEISLADDSVLERLNSLLEPERQLVLTERGMEDNADITVIVAKNNFHFIGTMNPGGDFGKKELSPALRNRFTEIWCDSTTSREDLLKVLERITNKGISLGNQEDGSSGIGNSILDFTDWLKRLEVTNKFPFSIRDLLSWVHFINASVSKGLLDTPEAYVHGACMTFLDCFGTALTGHIDNKTLNLVRDAAINYLLNQIKKIGSEYTDSLREMLSNSKKQFNAEFYGNKFGIKPFYIELGPNVATSMQTEKFTFTAPTTGSNTLRLLRGLQLNKAILLEGNPGVGKTSLVTALAKFSGYKVIRINLSDQTDITDLFGTDLPTEDGSFVFKEGAFLSALQNGDWILLDELNLAPQSVLEGLNACLDHRGEVFIPELGQTFKVKEQTRLFACQNPLKQGGARRGLPVSFLNRFTQVYIDTLTKEDLMHIVESQFPSLPTDILHRIVNFNCKVAYEICEIQSWGFRGGPWEMNLRDIQRWGEALVNDQNEGKIIAPGKYVDMLYINRMRTVEDKNKMLQTYDDIFCPEYPRSHSHPQLHITDEEIMIGDVTVRRNIEKQFLNRGAIQTNSLLLRHQTATLKTLAQCVKMNWLSILVGPTATGKSTIVQMLAHLTGNDLRVVPVTSAMDVSDLLGGFEQVDYNRNLENMFDKIETLTIEIVRNMWIENGNKTFSSYNFLSKLHEYKKRLSKTATSTQSEELNIFNEKLQFLLGHCKKLVEDGKLNEESSYKLRDVISNLKYVESKMTKVSSVNVGGKFEWVDSLLVKTLIEGSWLLLDNVNLTSAAVLDRLNGLLEPSGVLSIAERGEISEIKPHPNFRVFFTMDPKYGEISRAMRNRGVELFLLGPDDSNNSLVNTMPYMDLTALLSSCGLSQQHHDLLMKCHDLMASFVQGLEKPTISHLLQAAHLIWQQIVRAIPVNIAIKNSFSEVYIKPRCGSDFVSNANLSLAEMKNHMLRTLENHLNSLHLAGINSDFHTLPIKGICKDSVFQIAKQMSYIVVRAANVNIISDDMLSYVLFNIYVTYQRCPSNNVTLLCDIIKEKLLKRHDDRNQINANKLVETALGFISSCSESDSSKRFYCELFKLDEKVIHTSNVHALLLFNYLSKNFAELSCSKHKFSVLDYSDAIAAKTLIEDFVEYPLLKYCRNYLNAVNSFIEKAVKSLQDHFDDATFCHLLVLMNWRNRFYKICTLSIFMSNKGNIQSLDEKIVKQLYTHSNWLQKYLFAELFRLLPPNHDLVKDCKKICQEITTNVDQNSSLMSKVSKMLRKLYGQPKQLKCHDEYDLCVRRSKINKRINLDFNQPLKNQIDKFTLNVNNICNYTFALDIPTKEEIENIEVSIAKLNDKYDENRVKIEMMQLPINSYVSQRVLRLLCNAFYSYLNTVSVADVKETNLTNDLNEILQSLIHFGGSNKVFSPEFKNLLQLKLALQDGSLKYDEERMSNIVCKLWDEFYKVMVYSAASYPIAFLDYEFGSTEIDEAPTNTKRMSLNLPLLLYYLQKITLSKDHEGARYLLAYDTLSLEERINYSNRICLMVQNVWKNIATLHTSVAVSAKINAHFEMKKFEQLILNLQAASGKDLDIFQMSMSIIEMQCEIFKDDIGFGEMLREAYSIYDNLRVLISDEGKNKMTIETGTAQLLLLTSLLFLRLMAEMKPVDSVEKHRLKTKYIEEDLQMFESLLSAYYMQGLVYGNITEHRDMTNKDVTLEVLNAQKAALNTVHPHCGVLLELRDKTAVKINKYASGNTYRPQKPTYDDFAKYCRHFSRSMLSAKTISELSRNLLTVSNNLLNDFSNSTPCKSNLERAANILKEATLWMYSVDAFSAKVNSEYADAFPDLAKPLLNSISQIVYSVMTLKDLIREMAVKLEQKDYNFDSTILNLMTYPSNLPKHGTRGECLNRFLSSNLLSIISKDAAGGGDSEDLKLAKIALLKMNLSELRMHCIAFESMDRVATDAVLTTLGALVEAWQEQQVDIEKKKQDDDALYVTKSKCDDEDDDAIAQREIKEMFPSFSDTDFAEFRTPILEQIPSKHQDGISKPKYAITPDDVSAVYKWHSSFIRDMTRAEWLPSPKNVLTNDVIGPTLQRYAIFGRIVDNACEALDANIEGAVMPGLLMVMSQIKDNVDGNGGSNAKFDFYNSPWVSETKQCVPLLLKVKETSNKLLDEWPDFPSLKDIIVVVNRILGFPVSSPVSRFLTGLELLRDKIEEWNKNAHKGNNMIEESLAVGQQIINWRKLEMAHWKECLNNLYQRKQAEAHKYWFYLYNVVKSYFDVSGDSEPVPASRVIRVLKDFMETSNLAEYEVRLDIIYAYHCHLVHLESSKRRDELLSILWNTYNYYSQFSAQVASHIKAKRAPIEKKLRDFVKICTWDRDLSYWSVKDTVDKAHKALHKHTKEFENILKESASICLVDNSTDTGVEHVGIWDRPKRATGTAPPTGGAYMIDTLNFLLLIRNVKKYLDESEQPCKAIPEGSLLSKVTSLLNKCKSLCKDTIANTGYPSHVQALDDFVTLVIETSSHLASLEVDGTLPKEKQISHAKSFAQQKRKALADLFKYLTKMGLNYRTGLVILAASAEELYDFTIQPIDLKATISYLKNKRCDPTLALLWSGCEKYFQKSIARHRFLSTAMLTPHKDLGIQNIERCKGFAAQLMKLTNVQKKSISKYSRYLFDLRKLSTNLMNVLEIDCGEMHISNIKEKLDILTECYALCSLSLEQFKVLLKSLPEKSMEFANEPEFDSVLSNSPIVRCYKNSDEWHDLKNKISSMTSTVNKQKLALLKLIHSNPYHMSKINDSVLVMSQSHIDITKEATENLQVILKDVDAILQQYHFELKNLIYEIVPEHPILKTLVDMQSYLKETISKLKSLNVINDVKLEENYLDAIINESEDLIASMLLIIQSVYKIHCIYKEKSEGDGLLHVIQNIVGTGNFEIQKEESNDILEDKHLKDHLQDKLSNDVKLLQLGNIVHKIEKLIASYMEYMLTSNNIDEGKQIAMRIVPILEQTVLFVQYFVTQKVAVHRVSCKMLSVLLKIFSDLATKGFCKPSDLDTEEGDGEDGPGKLSSGTGLGEGEGQRDVSDRIENQDQLEEANRPGEERQDEDRDCKEEEQGINMTDDFDSHLQDLDKNDDDIDEEDDEDDIDKQMDEIDNAAEKLDQQIWGSEDEDIEEDLDKNEKGEKGTGESTGEKEIGAKEEEQRKDDGSEGKDKKQKKDINEMEDQEVDDDHVDPHHGKHQPLPEPEDFELPENTNLDGDDEGEDDKFAEMDAHSTTKEDEQDGETESEKPFEIDVTKDDMPKEIEETEPNKEEEKEKDEKHGFGVSSDEEDEQAEEKKDDTKLEDEQTEQKTKDETNPDENKDAGNEDDEKAGNQDELQPDESECAEQNQDKEELPQNPDKPDDNDDTEEKKHEANAQATPSNDDPTAENQAENAEMDKGTDDNVETNAEQSKDEEAAPFEQKQEQVGEDTQSMGRSDLDKSEKGHRGEREKASRADTTREKQKKHENKPGKTDEERTLGDVHDKKHDQMQTLNVEREEQTEDGGEGQEDAEKDADAFQHVKQAKKDDLQAIDAATKDQADQQPTLQQEEEEADALKQDEDVAMDVDDDEIQMEKSEELKAEKLVEGSDKDKEKAGSKNDGTEEATGETGIEVEGEAAVTENVRRGLDTAYHTRLDDSKRVQAEDMSVQEYMSIREWLTCGPTHSTATVTVWRGLWQESTQAARALCERLRLVLEPTGRSRMSGDFRTGRAINMRRVIPYIASHFRKDRIWLRRTKPAKREYKIAIAVDDSSSMADNRSKELAFESLALVSQALNLLESGDLAVLSFGEQPNLLHPFTEQFSEHSGSKILEQLRFEQKKTKIAQLLDFCTVLFEDQTAKSDALNAKLLVIVSDGRGIFSEGETRVIQAVRRARQQGIFLVYVIIDNPDNRDSIMDIRRPLLDPATNTLSGFVSYLDTFPFPFYLILRDMSALPTVLGDALRQWFELAANTS